MIHNEAIPSTDQNNTVQNRLEISQQDIHMRESENIEFKKIGTINAIFEIINPSDSQEDTLRDFLNGKNLHDLKILLEKTQKDKGTTGIPNQSGDHSEEKEKLSKKNPHNTFTDEMENRLIFLMNKADITGEEKSERKKLKYLQAEAYRNLTRNNEDTTINAISNSNEIVGRKITEIRNSIPKEVLEKHKNLLVLFSQAEKEEGQKKIDLLKEIIKVIEKNAEPLIHDLALYDEKYGTDSLEKFKSIILRVNPTSIPAIHLAEKNLLKKKIRSSYIKTTLGIDDLNSITQSEGIISANTGDGYKIEAGENDRTISLAGNDFAIRTDINNVNELKKIQKIEASVLESLSPLSDEIATITQAISYIDSALIKGENLEDIKITLQYLYPEYSEQIHLNNASSLAEIKQNILNVYEKIENKKQDLIKKAKQELDGIVSSIQEKIYKKDSLSKDILDVHNNSIINVVNQDEIEKAFTLFNNTPLSIDLGNMGQITSIDVSTMNITGSRKVENTNGKVAPYNKEIYYKIINVMISGNPHEPLSETEIKSVSNNQSEAFKNKSENMNILRNYGVLSKYGSLDLKKIEANIKRS